MLESSIELNDAVQAASLPVSGQNFNGKDCMISGWGRTVAGGGKQNCLFVYSKTPVCSLNKINSFTGQYIGHSLFFIK